MAGTANTWARIIIFVFVAPLCISQAFGGRDPLAIDLPEPAVPPNAEAFWIARRMAMNGVPMTIRAFVTPASQEEVVMFYKNEWKAAEVKRPPSSPAGGWITVGVEHEGHYVSVQLRSSGLRGTEGYIVVTEALAGGEPDLRTLFPLPPQVTVLSKQDYLDGGIRAESIVASSRRGVTVEARHMKSRLMQAHWLLVAEPAISDRLALMEFQRGGEHCQVYIQHVSGSAHATKILVNWRK